MNRADRLASVALLVLAVVAWAAVAWLLFSYDPESSTAVLLAGALLIGAGAALTLTPLLWLAVYARHRGIAYRGDWWRAARRGALVGLVLTVFVVLRGQGLFSLPLASFVVAMAVLVELTLSLRR